MYFCATILRLNPFFMNILHCIYISLFEFDDYRRVYRGIDSPKPLAGSPGTDEEIIKKDVYEFCSAFLPDLNAVDFGNFGPIGPERIEPEALADEFYSTYDYDHDKIGKLADKLEEESAQQFQDYDYSTWSRPIEEGKDVRLADLEQWDNFLGGYSRSKPEVYSLLRLYIYLKKMELIKSMMDDLKADAASQVSKFDETASEVRQKQLARLKEEVGRLHYTPNPELVRIGEELMREGVIDRWDCGTSYLDMANEAEPFLKSHKDVDYYFTNGAEDVHFLIDRHGTVIMFSPKFPWHREKVLGSTMSQDYAERIRKVLDTLGIGKKDRLIMPYKLYEALSRHITGISVIGHAFDKNRTIETAGHDDSAIYYDGALLENLYYIVEFEKDL